jgi:hypothetical protein
MTLRSSSDERERGITHVGTADWPIEAWIKYALSKCPR